MLFRQTKTENFIAFWKSRGGRGKRTKMNTSFDVRNKWANPKILEESLKEIRILVGCPSTLLAAVS